MIQLLVLLFSLQFAQAGQGLNHLDYYQLQSATEAEFFAQHPDFRDNLQDLLEEHHRSLSYSQARKILFGELHLRQDNDGYYITCVYCENDFHSKQFHSKAPGPYKIPDANRINTEHTWPQSRFSSRHSKGTQKTDLHALFPTTSSANSSRGNNPFGEVGKRFDSPCTKSKRGPEVLGKGMVFEPPLSHKGNVARALFYFAVRYDIKISAAEEEYLRYWHEEDPVDSEEEWRNQKVYEAQGVRNPFIDFPEWTDSIQDF